METQAKEVTLGDFDPHIVHHRNALTKRVVRVNAYRMIVSKGIRYFEWPKSSGNLWYEDRTPAGILNTKGEIVLEATHKAFTPPITDDEAIAAKNTMLEQENKKLQAELTAIKKEAEADKAIAKDEAVKAQARTVSSSKEAKTEVASSKTTQK